MASNTSRYRAILSATDKASPVFKRVARATAALGAVAVTVGVVQLGRKLVGGLQDSVQAAAKYESATVRLAVALGNQGQFTRENVASLQAYATELSKVSLATETQILAGLAQAKSLGASDAAARSLISAATDLASATGVDMDTAFRQTTRTLGGFAGGLGELFPELKKLTKEQLQAGEAARVLAERVGGAGAAGARTFEGAVNNLNSSLERTRVLVGGPLTEVFREVILELTGLVDEFNETVAGSDRFRLAVLDLAIALAEAGKGIEPLIEETKELADTFARSWEIIVGVIGPGIVVVDLMTAAVERLSKSAATSNVDTFAEKLKDTTQISEGETFFDRLVLRFEELKRIGPGEVLDGITNAVQSQTEATTEANAAVEAYTETLTIYQNTLLTTQEAIDQFVVIGKVIDEVGRLDVELRRTFRETGVQGAVAFGDAMVDAAFRGKLEFGKFFKALLYDIARAITQALVLRAILGLTQGIPFFKGGFGAQSGFSGASILGVSPVSGPIKTPLPGAGGIERIDLRVTSDIPILVERISDEVASERAFLTATDLAGSRTVR